jgi:predicted DsbA family dithiol-disulfide isomerase
MVTTIEVFAEVGCPFTHIGLRRFTARRQELGRDDVRLRVRAWPLEIVNGQPLDADFIAEEVEEIRPQVAPDLFAGFTADSFPASSLPALALEAAAYEVDLLVGERVSLDLRDRLFEQGQDIGDPTVLDRIASGHGVSFDPGDSTAPKRDHREGVARGVVGSPHFFTPTGGFFCPSLDVRRDDAGHLVVSPDPAGLQAFLDACFH